MKQMIRNTVIIVLLTLMALTCAEGQLSLVKDKKQQYMPLTVKSAGAIDTNFTTSYVVIPQGVNNVIAYLEIDTVGTTDTLDVAIYGSSDAVKWSLISSFSSSVAVGNQRKEIVIPDPYIRFVGTYTAGSTYPKHQYGRIRLAPR